MTEGLSILLDTKLEVVAMKILLPKVTPEGWDPKKYSTKKENLRLMKIQTQRKVMTPMMMMNLRRGDHNG